MFIAEKFTLWLSDTNLTASRPNSSTFRMMWSATIVSWSPLHPFVKKYSTCTLTHAENPQSKKTTEHWLESRHNTNQNRPVLYSCFENSHYNRSLPCSLCRRAVVFMRLFLVCGLGEEAQVFEQDKFPSLLFNPFLDQLLVCLQSQKPCSFILGPCSS